MSDFWLILSSCHIKKNRPNMKPSLVTSNTLYLLSCCCSQDSWPVGAPVCQGDRGWCVLKRQHWGRGRVQQNMHTTQMKLENWFKKDISLVFNGLKKMRELQQVLQSFIAMEFLKFQALTLKLFHCTVRKKSIYSLNSVCVFCWFIIFPVYVQHM